MAPFPPKGRRGAAALGTFFKGANARGKLVFKKAGGNLDPVFKIFGGNFTGPFFRGNMGPLARVKAASGTKPVFFNNGLFFKVLGSSTAKAFLKGLLFFLGFLTD